MTDFVGSDTQAIVFGSDPQTDFVNLMGRLARHGLAPTELTEQQKEEINNNPSLAKSRQRRSKALTHLKKQGYKSYVAAKKAGMGQRYEKYQKRITSLRKTLEAKRLKEAIAEFHKTIHGKEIAQQLSGPKPTKDALAPSPIQYELEERAEVARLFSEAPHVTNREELFQLRMKLVSALARLCNRRESPRRSKVKLPRANSKTNSQLQASFQLDSVVHHDVSVEATPSESQASRLAGKICPFCRWQDSEVGEGQRYKKWRIDSLAKHIRSQHLQRIEMPFRCPYGDCLAVLGTDEHFANHSARAHGDHYPSSIVSR
jgi:hypothetical protein